MRKRPRVALIIETSNDYARGLLHGVVAYIREHRPWSIYLAEHGRGDQPPPWLERWGGDGIIARVENEGIARAVRRSGLPVVDVSAARFLTEAPWVETDDRAIARLAAEHFLERGFRHFAFCGDERFNWSKWRAERFAERLRAAGFECHAYEPGSPPTQDQAWEQQEADIARWVKKLPKPVGLLACYDIRGQQVLSACRRVGAAVPDEVAVLGVDNDELLCDLCDPPLSSVIPNTHRTGYEAARLLARMMANETVPPEAHLIKPLGIVTRRSSDVLAIDDREIANAMHFIREHACDGINVEDVLDHVPLSRRVLESRFKALTGQTPHEQILKTKLDRARQLLGETELPLAVIAERSGFKHVEYLSVVFKKKIGVPPSVYRQRGQDGS